MVHSRFPAGERQREAVVEVSVDEDVGDTVLLPRFLPCCPACSPVDHVVIVALVRIEKFIQSRVSEHGLGQHLCAYRYRHVFVRGRVVRPDTTFPAGQSTILPARRQPVDDYNHNTSDSDAEDGLSACFVNERPFLILCPARRLRRASAPARGLKSLQYVLNTGKNRVNSWHQTTPVVYLCW